MSSLASTILMVRPAAFTFNEQTAVNNSFQSSAGSFSQLKVLEEFDGFVAELRREGIEVMVVEDTAEPLKPDAVFPNNWFCTLPGGKLAIFPMFAPNRRQERREDMIKHLKEKLHLNSVEDYTASEKENRFLEGTGSMVIDHGSKTIYACLSPRTDKDLLQKFAANNGYEVVAFTANDEQSQPIYHTNVMMHIGDSYAVVCTHSITDDKECKMVLETLKQSGHVIVPITYEQMNHFAGNMLQVQSKQGQKITVLSRQAYHSLTPLQIESLMAHTLLLPVDITTIETVGGGSARCMMAEVFE
jgi:hypothetical protein